MKLFQMSIRTRRLVAMVVFLTLLSPAVGAPAAGADDADGLEFFEKRIRPVLIRHCYECHSSAATEAKAGLRLDSRDGIRAGGETGPSVVPGNADDSLLIAAIRHESLQMPPEDRLPESVILDFVKWIEMGAPDPRDHPPTSAEVAELSWQTLLDTRRDWWSFQPVHKPSVPALSSNTSELDHPIDRFVHAHLAESGLGLSPEAKPLVLLRRLSLILTGLPPTAAEVSRFEEDVARHPRTAYAEAVARLLDSPHFGERWARHWMDVVRFAETHGYEWNHEIRDVWQYRDYLIRAFNSDVPYDQFVREHIAGDLLASPRIDTESGTNESVIGTAFWRFGELGHDDCVKFPEIRFDALDNQIDTLTKAFQATTVSCARCHDHKFDPISTRDYYALVGILESSRQVVQTVDTADRIATAKADLERIKRAIRRELAVVWLAAIEQLDDRLLAALAPAPRAEPNPLRSELARADMALENPTSLLQRISSVTNESDFQEAWSEISAEYAREGRARAEFNAANFVPFAGQASLAGWSTAGLGPEATPSQPGEFAVAFEGDRVLPRLLPAGIYTHLVSSRLNGTVQSPWMPGERRNVSIQFSGGGLSMVRPVVDSCALNEYVGGGLTYISDNKLQWQTYPTRVDATHRAFLELTTKTDNVRWPDRPGVAGTEEALLESPRSWFGVVRAVAHDCDEPPRPELSHMLLLFEQPEPASLADALRIFRDTCQRSVSNWQAGACSDDDVRWINWLLLLELLPQAPERTGVLDRLVREYRLAESAIPVPRVVAGMADHGPGFASPVLVRGNPLQPGPLEPRRYLEVVAGSRAPFASAGSGRKELADLIASSQNPLTARVMVNRVWHHLFGAGLVRTTDDFGHLGDTPSHPQLLDFLADQFVHEGWSVKKLITSIVASQTFRQSSVQSRSGRQRDPTNRLLHHFPVRRLDAEAIRDTLLAVSGGLDRSLYGPSIQPFRAEPKEHRKLYAGPLDGGGRRSIYLKVTRMEGPRFLELFDLPDLTATRGRRDRTNVPAQALALLNDPFVIDQASRWGKALVLRGAEPAETRLDYVFWRTLTRAPSEPERQRMVAFVEQLAGLHGVTSADIPTSEQIWQDVAHAMFNVKELIYVR